MSRFPISVRSQPRSYRALLRFIGLLAVLLCAVVCRPPATPRTNPPALEENPPALEKEIRGGEVHTYPIELQAGQFVRVIAEENSVDLSLRLLDPQGALVIGTDPPEADDTETEYVDVAEDLAAVAATPGTHRLEIAASGEGSGRYLLRIEGPRKPSPADHAMTEAVRATWGALTSEVAKEERTTLLERALTLWRQVGDNEKTAEVLFRLGRLHYLKANEQALASFRHAAEDWALQPNRRRRVALAESLTHAGRCLWHLGRRAEARAAHDRALGLASDLGEKGLGAENLNLLGRLDTEEGELRGGVERFVKALDLAREVGDRKTEASILNNLAVNYERLGKIQQALEYYGQALELAREAGNREHEMTFLNNLGDTYRSLGNWKTAFDYYLAANGMSGFSEDNSLKGSVLINLSDAYRQRGQLDEARSALDQALTLGREINSPKLQSLALDQLAFLSLDLKQPALAEEVAREAVGLKAPPETQSLSHFALGSALRDLGDSVSARTELAKALDLAGRLGLRSREVELNLVLARMDRDVGDLGSALSRIHSAIQLIEERRGGVVDQQLRISLLASRKDYYELEIDILMALQAARPNEGFAAAALKVSEQARARSLLDILNEADADIRRGIDPTLAAKEQEAREQVNARDWYRRKVLAEGTPDPQKVAEAERRLSEALEYQKEVQVDLRLRSPHYAALTQPQPLSVEEIQHQVIDGDALLLEYSLGTKRSFLWLVTHDSIRSFELPGREEIEASALRYYELLTTRNNRRKDESIPDWKRRITKEDAQAEDAGRNLARLILGPAERLLGDRPLLIVADGALQYIPFAALPISATGAPLATRHVIVNLPSASVLAALRRELRDRPRGGMTLAIFADPVFQKDDARLSSEIGAPGQTRPPEEQTLQRGGRLEGNREKEIDVSNLRRLTFTQKEADAIAALVSPDQVFKAVGFAASRSAVANSTLENFRNIHFATHGVLDSEYPEASGLVLSLYTERGEPEDGVLRLNDIYNLWLSADLVVLSACQTALGKEIRGEGIVGLTRGFMYAGAARVLASLWSVEDRPTAELMESFYRGMLRDGLSPAEALRKAQLEIARKPNRKSPYFWAGFSLQGEWR